MPILILSLLFLCVRAAAEEFAGEPFVEGSSVADNGTSAAIPSRLPTASQFLDFPAGAGPAGAWRVELATLPSFGDLAQSWNGAAAWSIGPSTALSLFAKLESTPDIESRPVLRGTHEDRLNDPGYRPLPCDGCALFTDYLYMGALNVVRMFRAELPRSGIAGRQVPLEMSLGVTAKYYLEELAGPQDGDVFLSNLNLDAGAAIKLFWGWNPVDKTSDRDIRIQLTGLELLPTPQQTDIAGNLGYESMTYRWRFSADWVESIPALASTLAVGFSQKSEGGRVPALGAEWGFRDRIFVRAGRDDDFLSAGMSLAWRGLSVHYALRLHELGTTWYQVSGQLALP